MSRADIVRAQLQVSRCTRCPLAGSNVPMSSPADAAFAVMGEAPGRREVQLAEPFVGPAGRKLRRSLERAGLDPDTGAYFNTVSCLPGRMPPTPEQGEVAACLPNRTAQLAATGTEILLACGAVALRCWRTDVPISTAWNVPLIRGDLVVIPSIHPAAVLYDGTQAWKLDKACRTLAMLVTGDGLAGTDLLGGFCLRCNRRAEVWDRDWWPWCRAHGPREMTAKRKEKLMRDARTRVNRSRQGSLL